MMACRDSNCDSTLETVKLLIKSGANVDKRDTDGWTALMMACRYSNCDSSLETVELLIESGANIDMQDKDGYTALMIACRNSNRDSNIETVKILLKAGANLNKRNNKGRTALIIACENSNNGSNVKTIKELIKHGCGLNLVDNNGNTAFLTACFYVGTKNNIETIEELVKNNCDVNVTNNNNIDFYYRLKENYKDNEINTELFMQANKIIVPNLNMSSFQNLLKHHDKMINNLLFEMYKYDQKKMFYIVPKLNQEQFEDWIYYSAQKLFINKNIIKQKKHIYEKPGNIICMCAETLFYIKQKNKNLLNKMPNKLKFLFDIKTEQNIKKFYYYLELNYLEN